MKVSRKPTKEPGSLLEFASHLLDLSARYNAVERAVDHINSAIESLVTNVNRSMSEVAGRVTKLEQRLGELERITMDERGVLKFPGKDDFTTKH